MTTIYDAAILLVDDNPDLLTLGPAKMRRPGSTPFGHAEASAPARRA